MTYLFPLLAKLIIGWLYSLQRGKTFLPIGHPGYGTKLHLMVMLQFWKSEY